MLTSKALFGLYDQLRTEQQQDFIRESYKNWTVLTDEEWNMFIEPWLDELSRARLHRVEEIVQILRRYWVRYEIHEKAIWFYVNKDSTGENYSLPKFKEYTAEQINNSALYWTEDENQWQYIRPAFEAEFFLMDHVKSMEKLGYVFESAE